MGSLVWTSAAPRHASSTKHHSLSLRQPTVASALVGTSPTVAVDSPAPRLSAFMTSIADIEARLRAEALKEERKCGKCGKFSTMQCSRCRSVHYCGVACQRAHWKEHKPDCQAPSETTFKVDEDQVSLLVQAAAEQKLTDKRARELLSKHKGEIINAMVEAESS